MKRFILFFLFIFFAVGVFAQVGTLTVTVLSSEAGTGITVVDYEFSGPAGAYNISAEVDFDDEDDFLPIDNDDISGNLTNIEPGVHSFTWDGKASFDERYSEQTVVRLTATQVCGDTYSVTFTYKDDEVTYGTVWRGGLCWLDRNLGASRVATASDDYLAYGDLFQWGRGDDGHQVVTWTGTTTGDVTPETSTLSTTDVPGHGVFITTSGDPHDWRANNNDNRWNANPQENNPCPPGWRVPTEAELEAERLSWGTGNNNSAGAFDSDLKWPVGGGRYASGTLDGMGSGGYVWGSSVSGDSARGLGFLGGDAVVGSGDRAHGMSVRCVRGISEEPPALYNLQLDVNPEGSGSVSGAGEYQEGEVFDITATANEGWEFVNWTGDVDHIDDAGSATATVTMPSENVTLTANFQEDDDPEPGTVTDIDGNVYQTVIIGNQEWMAENLRVTKYNNGDAILTGLNNTDWQNTTSGAYAIYNNNNDMLEAYGALYNWYAVATGNLCPTGWHVPSDEEWTELVNYLDSQGFPNSDVPGGAGNAGNALKSCRQVDSPLDGCNTSEHPRWNPHPTNNGFDEFGFSALPGGRRSAYGSFYDIGTIGFWWSSTGSSSTMAWHRSMDRDNGNVTRASYDKPGGFSLRCVRD